MFLNASEAEGKGAHPGSWAAFLIQNCIAGVIAGWITVSSLLWLDVAGLSSLMMSSDLFPLPLLMLFGFFGITFGGVATGSAIMALRRRDPASMAHVPFGRERLPVMPRSNPRPLRPLADAATLRRRER